MTILAVDPDMAMTKLISFLLEEVGYRVFLINDSLEVLSFFREHEDEIDLILLEVSMPKINGFDVCRQIRYVSNVPIIFISARGQLQDRVTGLQIGGNDYLVKPFEPSELLARVEVALRTSRNFATSEPSVSFDSQSVEMSFDFPETVKVPCQQYLLYFVEFLRDVGIDATAQLKEEAGEVLFSVTPDDKDEALDNIREALEVYLQLPVRQVAPMVSIESGIEVQRLGSQVLHLQSQIMLGNALAQQQAFLLQQKDIVIDQQKSAINQHLVTGQVLVQSLQKEGEDKAEPIAGEIVRVKRWNPENIPLDVDLPEVIRWLKEKFSRKNLP